MILQVLKEAGMPELAERKGFEPSIPSPVYSLSRGVFIQMAQRFALLFPRISPASSQIHKGL